MPEMIEEKSKGNLDCEEEDTKFLPQFPSAISNLVLACAFRNDPGALGIVRSVCKNWSRIVRPSKYSIDMEYKRYPYLMSLVNGTCNFFHPTYNHTFCLNIPDLQGAEIKSSKFDWLLLSRYDTVTSVHEYFFFNLFTKERKDLPKNRYEFVAMSFSSPPTSSDCFVVGVGFLGLLLATIKYGEEGWTLFSNEECHGRTFLFGEHIASYNLVFYKQKCYCLAANKKLVVIDPNTRKYWMVGKIFSTDQFEFRGCFLAEDKEGLLSIFQQTEKRIPHVMKMDLSQKKLMWQPVENLNNKMVYASHATSWSDSAPTKSTGNKIYFPILWNPESIFYSLSTRKYHSFSENYRCSDLPFQTQMMTNCTWIYVD